MPYNFSDKIEIASKLKIDSNNFSSYCIHRVNLPDASSLLNNKNLKELISLKTGIAVIDSSKNEIMLPPGSAAEVDFWILGNGKVVLTHNNPEIERLDEYPTSEEFLKAWSIKRKKEIEIGVTPGFILANLKTHGQEEWFLEHCQKLGIPSEEIVFLDLEYPEIDRLMRNSHGKVAPLSVRTSRIESLDSVLMAVKQSSVFGTPHSVFFDPIGTENPETLWPFESNDVKKLYELAPNIELIVCCPSRWGRDDQIRPLALRIKESGFKKPIIMTDIDKIPSWNDIL